MRWSDRLFWLGLRHTWSDWRSALVVIRPATVIGWHRRGFARYWTWKSRRRPCRRPIDVEFRRLVRDMASANPFWDAPRIHGELLKLGSDVSERTVSRLMPRRRRPPSQSWRTFLLNHMLVVNERHLRRMLRAYLAYYHRSRTHLSLRKDTPDARPVQASGSGRILAFPEVGGLHLRCERCAA